MQPKYGEINFMYFFLCFVSIFGSRTSIIVIGSDPAEENELMGVVVFYRHGDRAPFESFPTDKYFDPKYWPMGFTQLTNLGKIRHYNLGKWFRQRYNTFLPSRYSSEDIYVYSTNTDRTLMSAYTNLAGLYPPEHDQIWKENLLWQPIPVHTAPRNEDLIYKGKRACAIYDKLINEVENNDFFKRINEKFANLYRYLSEKTGMHVKDVGNIRLIRSVFYTYQNYNSSFIPSWYKSLNRTAIDYLAGLAYQSKTYTHQLKRLDIGFFFNGLLSYINNIDQRVSGTPRLLMYSGHDTCITSALNSMDVYDLYPVGFADTVIWEIKKKKNGQIFINLLYKAEKELKKLHIKGCDFDCDIKFFVKKMSKVAIDVKQWNLECENY